MTTASGRKPTHILVAVAYATGKIGAATALFVTHLGEEKRQEIDAGQHGRGSAGVQHGGTSSPRHRLGDAGTIGGALVLGQAVWSSGLAATVRRVDVVIP